MDTIETIFDRPSDFSDPMRLQYWKEWADSTCFNWLLELAKTTPNSDLQSFLIPIWEQSSIKISKRGDYRQWRKLSSDQMVFLESCCSSIDPIAQEALYWNLMDLALILKQVVWVRKLLKEHQQDYSEASWASAMTLTSGSELVTTPYCTSLQFVRGVVFLPTDLVWVFLDRLVPGTIGQVYHPHWVSNISLQLKRSFKWKLQKFLIMQGFETMKKFYQKHKLWFDLTDLLRALVLKQLGVAVEISELNLVKKPTPTVLTLFGQLLVALPEDFEELQAMLEKLWNRIQNYLDVNIKFRPKLSAQLRKKTLPEWCSGIEGRLTL